MQRVGSCCVSGVVPLLGGVYQPHVPHDFALRHCLNNSDEYPIDQILTIDCSMVEYETPSTYHILYVCGVHLKAYIGSLPRCSR